MQISYGTRNSPVLSGASQMKTHCKNHGTSLPSTSLIYLGTLIHLPRTTSVGASRSQKIVWKPMFYIKRAIHPITVPSTVTPKQTIYKQNAESLIWRFQQTLDIVMVHIVWIIITIMTVIIFCLKY